jgi:hypothetical protein
MDSREIADLRREIEGLQELNRLYRSKRYHTFDEKVAHEKRKIRLEEIKKKPVALRKKH